MPRNYKSLTENITARINPEKVRLEKALTDDLSSISYSDVLVYVRYAMNGVDPLYTQKSMEAGENAKQHLKRSLTDVTFRYQGSVMTNTHIKAHSDIDLLTISDKFYTFDRSGIEKILESNEHKSRFSERSINKLENEIKGPVYGGRAIDDLRQLRLDCERILSREYSTHDLSNGKAIKITNLGLRRDVDVVIANWYDDVSSIINDRGEYRGVQIYNKDTDVKGSPDYPFLSIERINERSSTVHGRLKKMIRFLKNVKAESAHEINLSSFDINAICYDIDPSKYSNLTFLQLVPVIYNQLKSICTDKFHADKIVSVDGREYIFRGNDKSNNLKLLWSEVIGVYNDLNGI